MAEKKGWRKKINERAAKKAILKNKILSEIKKKKDKKKAKKGESDSDYDSEEEEEESEDSMMEDPLREEEVPIEKTDKKTKRKEELNRASAEEKSGQEESSSRIKPFDNEKPKEGDDEDSMDQTIDQLMNGDGSLKNMYKQ